LLQLFRWKKEMTVVVVDGLVRTVRVFGPLESYAQGFPAVLRETGYTELSIVDKCRLLARLSRWMWGEGVGVEGLTWEVLDRFLTGCRLAYSTRVTRVGLRPVVVFLSSVAGLRLAQEPLTQLGVLAVYRAYLVHERRLAAVTVHERVRVARVLVDEYAPSGEVALVGPADVTRALLDHVVGHTAGSVQQFGCGLRGFLRFCFISGIVDRDLTGAVAVVRRPSPSQLPIGADPSEVEVLLSARGCDPATPTGQRDRAVILLMARLGLRAGEVARLRLDDIDWRGGQIEVAGKGGKTERMPLPAEVGQAIADYASGFRPRGTGHREVFLSLHAPARGIGRAAIASAVLTACGRAGITPIRPHRLRHTLAEAMIRAEVPLAGIGQVLRHDSSLTTANYARVDIDRLRTLAGPWPAAPTRTAAA
jgi:integrase/recombinase XerD